MNVLLKASAGAIIALVLGLVLQKQYKEMSVLLSVCVCCILSFTAFSMLEPVLDFFATLEATADIDSELLSILLKATGIGFLGEITASICSDAGNSALGKILQMISSVLIVCVSVPLFETILNLIQEILQKV